MVAIGLQQQSRLLMGCLDQRSPRHIGQKRRRASLTPGNCSQYLKVVRRYDSGSAEGHSVINHALLAIHRESDPPPPTGPVGQSCDALELM